MCKSDQSHTNNDEHTPPIVIIWRGLLVLVVMVSFTTAFTSILFAMASLIPLSIGIKLSLINFAIIFMIDRMYS